MAVVIVNSVPVSNSNIDIAKQDYGDYIKFVADIERNVLAIGGEWHADAEKVLLEQGSKQINLWGGGIDLITGDIDYVSLINTRPNFNNSQEVTSEEIRLKMAELVKKYILTK